MRAQPVGTPPGGNLLSGVMGWVVNAINQLSLASYVATPASLVENDATAGSGPAAMGAKLTDVLTTLATRLTIADDGVGTISLAGYDNKAALIQLASNLAAGPNGSFWARADATNNARTVSFAAGPTIDFTTGALTGTTGVDGRITISADAAGLVYIENRSGGALIVTARILGA